MVDRLVPYLRGGKTRDDVAGLRSSFAASLAGLIEEAPDDVRRTLGIVSAYRSPERQKQLFDEAVAKYGSEAAARKWVAPPGRSKHNHGDAVDLAFGAKGTPEYDAARKYAHDNAAKYGLNFPMGHEPWHIEPLGARASMGDAKAGFGGLPAQTGVAATQIPVTMPDLSAPAPAPEVAPPQGGFDLGKAIAALATTLQASPPAAKVAAKPVIPAIRQPQAPVQVAERRGDAPKKASLQAIFGV